MSNGIKTFSTVLIVDDNEIDRLIHRKILERLKQIKEIHTASNGKQAIELLHEYSSRLRLLPDIILLDLNMPIMDGFSFIETFKRMSLDGKEGVTIIIVSSSSSFADINKAKEVGINRFVVKPLTEEKILEAIGIK